MSRALLAAVVALAACGPRAAHGAADRGSRDELTLYRDHAVIARRLDLVVAADGELAHVRLRVAAGIEPDGLYLVDNTELQIREAWVVADREAPGAPVDAAIDAAAGDDADDAADVGDVDESDDPDEPAADEPRRADAPIPTPSEVELAISAPHAGTFPIVVGYDTERIAWDAAYTVTITPQHDRATVRGALAIRNATGLALPRTRVWLVDADHGPRSLRIAERRGDRLFGHDDKLSPLATPRDLGERELGEGDTRLELLAGAPAEPMREVLVYDPVGTGLDHNGFTPLRDASLGLPQSLSSTVTEGVEIARDERWTSGLPAGPVRLFERRTDGALAVLAEARIFEQATRLARADTIAIRPAIGVAGKRLRTVLTVDDDRKRLTEEFAITIENRRDHPVEVALREHFYRGQNWALAYQSVPLERATKEGAQQVAMRVDVPARTAKRPGKLTVMYVAVYTW